MKPEPLSPPHTHMLDAFERGYRMLLVCFPRDFREQHGEDAARLFRDKMRQALRAGSGFGAVPALVRGTFDLLREAAREHLEGRRARRAGSEESAAGTDVAGAGPTVLYGPPGTGGSPRRQKERLMESIVQDLRFAGRMVRKQPGFSALVVITLALGIGANTMVFSFVKALFLNPLGVNEVSTLVAVDGTVEEGAAPGFTHFPVSWPNYLDLREHNDTLTGLAAFGFAQAGLSDGAAEPQFEPTLLVSANYFEVLGVDAAVGRTFRPDEEEPLGAHAVVVISHDLWQERYSRDPNVVGRSVRINGHPFTIVGVAPQGFTGTNALFDVRLWAPISMHPQLHSYSEFVDARRWRMFQLFGRLEQGVSAERAEADLRTIAQRLVAEFPDDNRGRLVQVTPLAEAAIDPNQRDTYVNSSVFLLAVTGVVLLIACANVANLMLARARGRRREIAVRMSLGAGRGRIIRQLACEGLLLAAAGGAASIVVATLGRDLLWRYRPPFLGQSLPIELDLKVLALTAVLATATGLAFALVPALRATRVHAAASLTEGAATAGEGRGGRGSLRGALVVAQVALSFLAVIGAGLFLTSLLQAQRIDPGFDAERLLLVPLNPAAQGYTPEGARQFYDDLRRDLEAAGEIERVGFASNQPLAPTILSRTTIREGDTEDQATLIGTSAVTPGFFEAMGLSLQRGRLVIDADRADTRPVIVINDVMARRLWPDENPIGRRVRFLGEQEYSEVIGVVDSIKYNTLGEAPQPYFYQPLSQRYADNGILHVRTRGEPSAVAEQVRAAVREIDAELPLDPFVPATDRIEQSLWAPRMAASLLSVFGVLSLSLAVVGIYGVLAQLVGERRREIGIRIALGADRTRVVRLVARQTLRWVVIGGAVGVAGALAASRWLGSFLYGIEGTDPITYMSTAALLLLAATLAASAPARRAAAVDPAIAMRQE